MAPPTYFVSGPLIPTLYTEQEIKDMIHETYIAIYEYNAYRAASFLHNIIYAIMHTAISTADIQKAVLHHVRTAIVEVGVGHYHQAHNNVRDAYYLLQKFD